LWIKIKQTKRKDTQQVKTKYEIIHTKASPFGGLYVLSEFLNQIKFHHIFEKIFGKFRKVRNYTPADNTQLLMASIVAGAERLYDIERFSDDPIVADLFDVSSIPSDTTIRDDLMTIGHKNQQRTELLFQLNELLFDKLGLKSITIDIDGTAIPVDGQQQNAEKGYCPQEPGSRCFQSLTAICDETETTIAEETRPGNTHCANGIIKFSRALLDRFSPQMDQITLRLDAGFYSDDYLRFLESYDNVYYMISVPQHEWLQRKVTQLEYKNYYQSKREYASFAYGEGLNGKFRYYFVERTKKEAGTQTDMFCSNDYTYRVVLVNKEHQPHVIFREYNRRGRVEKHIEELKNQYALGKMVSAKFVVTKALFWICHLTFTIIGMLRCVAFRRQMVKYRLRRLRFLLFTTIAFYTSHARQKHFKIALAHVGPWQFKFLMNRIWAF
jgi:hypothetical protein